MILDANSVCGLIDNNLAELIHTIIVILKFCIPILLVVLGMLDLGKGVIVSKEDEIKKGQQMFIKRLISAVFVFFVVTIVQLVVGFVDDKNSGVMDCVNLILNGNVYDTKEDIEDHIEEKNDLYIICDFTNNGYTINDLKMGIDDLSYKKKCSANVKPIGPTMLRIDAGECLEKNEFKSELPELLTKYNCRVNNQ